MVTTRRLMPYAAVLAAAVTLSACSGGDLAPSGTTAAPTAVGMSTGTPMGTPTSSASSTSPTSTKVEDPVLAKIPKAARAETAEGAEAFVKFYFAQLNTAFREADPEAVGVLSTKSCIMCNALLEGVKDVKEKRQHYGSSLISVESTVIIYYILPKPQVLARIKQNPVRVLDAKGAVVETAPVGKGAYLFTLIHEDHWRIARVQEAR